MRDTLAQQTETDQLMQQTKDLTRTGQLNHNSKSVLQAYFNVRNAVTMEARY